MKSKRVRRHRQIVHSRVTDDVYRRLKAYCARVGTSESAVANTAFHQYLDQSSEAALVIRRLDRLTRRISRLQREIDVLAEFTTVWAKMWFAHTPQLSDDARKTAQQTAAKRYAELIDFLTKRMSGPKRFIIDLLGRDTDSETAIAASIGKPDGLPQ